MKDRMIVAFCGGKVLETVTAAMTDDDVKAFARLINLGVFPPSITVQVSDVVTVPVK
jgi:hypothetical protein